MEQLGYSHTQVGTKSAAAAADCNYAGTTQFETEVLEAEFDVTGHTPTPSLALPGF